MSAPGHFAPDYFFGSVGYICGRVHERGILAAEFQEYRGYILGCRFHDYLAHLGVSPIEATVSKVNS